MKLLLCVLLASLAVVTVADQQYTLNASDIYQSWGIQERAIISYSSSYTRFSILDTAVHADSNSLYACGYYGGSYQSRPSVSNSRDVFIAKYTLAGVQQWIRYLNSSGDEYATSCKVDTSGYVYLLGYTSNSLMGITMRGGTDGFLAKYSPSGVVSWVVSLGGNSDDFFYSLELDPDQNLVTMAVTYSQIGSRQYGYYDVYVGKYSSVNGAAIWHQQLGSPSYDYPGYALNNGFENAGKSLAVSATGDIYVGWSTDGTVNTSLTPRGNQDVYVAKLNSNGALQWTVQLASNSADWVQSLAVDNLGNVYAGGRTQGPIMRQLYAGNWDCYVSKISSDGTHQWTRTFGHGEHQEIYDLAVDTAGNVYTVGYSNAPTFDDEPDISPSTDYTNYRHAPAFISKLDTFGNRIFTRFFRADRGPRSPYYTTTATYPMSINVLSDSNGAATGFIIAGINNGIFNANDDSTYGDVTSYYSAFLISVTQSLSCALDSYNDILTEINNLFFSLSN